MTRVELRHEIQCDEAIFWDKCVLSEEYNRRLFVDHLQFPRYHLAEQREEGGKVHKRAEMEPKVAGVPGPAKKVLGDRLGYTEVGVFDRATNTYSFTITPSTLAEKSRIQGKITTKPAGPGKLVRHVEIELEVKVFAVGGLIEELIAKDLRASYDASASFTDNYVKTL